MSPVKGMDFARNLLLKYGWKEGKGLGRNETGIAEALKPKLKFDTRGVGHDASEQFTYHWWEHAFNEAANNVQVATTEDGVSVELQDDSIDITTKKFSKKALKKRNSLEYGTFLKTSTLTEGGQMVRVAQDVPEVADPIGTAHTLSDEDLFKICGGRTAHKGARHGLKLNGKLARIEEQERHLVTSTTEPEGNTAVMKKHKKKSKTKLNDVVPGAESKVVIDLEKVRDRSESDEVVETERVKKKLKKVKKDEDVGEETDVTTKKKKKRKHNDVEDVGVLLYYEDGEVRKKKKKNKRTSQSVDV